MIGSWIWDSRLGNQMHWLDCLDRDVFAKTLLPQLHGSSWSQLVSALQCPTWRRCMATLSPSNVYSVSSHFCHEFFIWPLNVTSQPFHAQKLGRNSNKTQVLWGLPTRKMEWSLTMAAAAACVALAAALGFRWRHRGCPDLLIVSALTEISNSKFWLVPFPCWLSLRIFHA